LAETDPSAHARLVERTGLAPGEPARWKRAADLMYLPYDEPEELHLQDDGFLDREPWDFEGTPADHYPLLLHYHPLVIYRHQVIKQADVVLATFLLGDAFSDEDKRRILEYYDPLTTGDSSLSESIQSIMAAEAGDLRAAEEYFFDSVSVDLADTAGNVRDGIHVASAGGTWMALVFGFAGMRDRGPELSFRPRLPDRMGNLSFSVQAHGATLRVEIRADSATYRLTSGAELAIRHNGERLHLVGGEDVTRPIPELERRRDAPTLARSVRAALKGA
jgi:alpha,alpha-trehalose phosphorylase